MRALTTASSARPDSAAAFATELVHAWGSWAPTLAPDGSRVAYISDRNGAPQLWVQDLRADAEARCITLSSDPVLAVHWSPDGQWLACSLATDGGVRSQVWVVRTDGTGARRVAGGRDQHATLGPWARIGHQLVVGLAPRTARELTRAVLVQPATGQIEPLAEGELVTVLDLSAEERFVLLRDGTRGAQFCVMVDRLRDEHHAVLPFADIGSTDVGLLRRTPPGVAEPLIAYLATDAGRPRRELVAQTLGPDGRRGSAGILAQRDDAELELLDADADGRLLALVWNVAGGSEVEIYDTVTRQRRSVPGLPDAVVCACVLSRDGSHLVLCLDGADRPRELWVAETADTETVPLVKRPAPVVSNGFRSSSPLVTPTLETFIAHDGLPLTGWLYRVPGRTEPGPTMLSFHGGPEAQERPVFTPQHQAMAAAGIAVFAPNIRGSSGFGRAFVHADDRYGRNDAITDVLTCAEFVIAHGVADPRRLAVSGRSYGGYLTLAAMVFYPELFAAGVDICGMSDLLTFYRDTEPWIAAAAVSKYGDPHRDKGLLKELSPMTRVDRIVTPLLVVHGELDTNVPIGEAHQIVAALRDLGRDVEYLQLDGEGHEYRRAETRLRLIERMTGFLVERLKA